MPPDWVCEIVSSGHEKKDTLTIPLLLRRHWVPYYWILWFEDGALIACSLDGGEWRVVATLKDRDHARLLPFEAVELDLGRVLGLD